MPGAADNRILDPNGEDGPKSTTKPMFFCVLFQTMVVPVVLGVRPDAAQQHTQAHRESRMNKGSPLTLHTTDLQPGSNIRRGRMPSGLPPLPRLPGRALADKATTCPPEALCLL